jgi:ClpP class serine protease
MRRFIPFLPKPARVPVIRLGGTIGSGSRSLNDETLAPLIDKAFKSKPVALALAVNSPGGSAVQSSLIAAIGSPVRRTISGSIQAPSSDRSA